MYKTDELIEKTIRLSQIPSGKRRREVERELRAHIEDFMLIAQQAGHTEPEIERMVLKNFGDPTEIADEFSWVYRRERAVLRLSVFLLSTLIGASFISAVALGLQASMAIRSGVPLPQALGGHHVSFELLYIFSTVASFVGIISLERLFTHARLTRAVLSLGLVFTLAAAVFAAANAHAENLIFGFVSGVLLRVIQLSFKGRVARIGAVVACFGLFGLVSACRQPSALTDGMIRAFAVWLTIGICSHLMTCLAARVDHALLNEIHQP